MDFTLNKYRDLQRALSLHKNVFLRHDVDVSTRNALTLARAESEMGIRSTYYFRARHFSSPRHVSDIKAIVDLGHSIGYHYENLTTCDGNVEQAYKDFTNKVKILRQLAPVSTACAHGSPTSKWDSQEIWKQHDIHTLGIDYEPMLDTDFQTTLYLTDTGRRWDGYRVSIRDKVPHFQEQWKAAGLSFHTTNDLIDALQNPEHAIHQRNLLINTHPERWIPFGAVWTKELLIQRLINGIKHIVIAYRQEKQK